MHSILRKERKEALKRTRNYSKEGTNRGRGEPHMHQAKMCKR
ncbi:MAG: hypothetical protein JETT_0474 [Candidatus Jettenia ecosi]|uniref:Uncharacterized protein n=1 Tax=Candidatus Jettenia ecosi TaxID=2494326 RepID=A0A533QRC8_9BACT|nr:MAG: hypothetical protein JETT_0474 [Candidatus Jettenia ecosi]